jgi:Ser/Thr protein kinase RdoA (MazF antagonist)
MRETWERRRDALHLDEATFKKLLQPLLSGGSITSAELLRAGRNNTLYKITAEDRDEALVTENALLLQAATGSRSLVHADYGGSNLLARQERGHFSIAAVLDWEFAFVGSSLFDLGNLFRYEWLLPNEFEAACLRGYVNHGGVLPSTWKKITKLLDLINICTFLQTPEPRGSLVEDMIFLIRWTLEHWETYQEH